MTRQLIELDQPVPEQLADELAKRIYFVADAIVDFSLVRTGAGVVGVEVAFAPGMADPDVARKLRAVVANDVLPQQLTPRRQLWRSPPGQVVPGGVFDELVRRGIAVEAGEGQVAVGEPVLGLLADLDAEIRTLARRELGAVEYRYPTLLPLSVLRRSGHLDSFPQQMMFVTRLHSDADAYQAFLADMAAAGDTLNVLAHCRDSDYCLPPTMCFHTYHQFRDSRLPAPSLVVTSCGKSFRFEARYRRTLERLWDFTIREVVFLGSRGFVLDSRQRLLEASIALVERLGLTGHCEVANDPFFLGRSAEQAWSQRLLELKYELRLRVGAGDDDTVAVASFNFHERFFASAFGIGSSSDEPLHTGCAGVGLERLAYAFLCHHGVDPSCWPAVRGERSG